MYSAIKAKCPQAILECPVVVKGNLFFVDVGLKDKLVYFEYDGEEYHKDIEHDKERDRLLSTFGWKGFHFNKDNWHLLTEDLDGILKSLTR
jgi:very-short-patch-repair endonuclease